MSITLPLVSHEQAVMLKELKFNYECHQFFQVLKGESEEIERDYKDNWNGKKSSYYKFVSRPTLALAAMWLREVKGLHLSIEPIWNNTENKWDCKGIDTQLLRTVFVVKATTHDLALSYGITAALLIVKNKEK